MTRGAERLLLVHGDAANREMLSRRLACRGYQVDWAEDAPGALEKIARAQYDLVLLDQRMPAMSGLDLLHLLRATYQPCDLPAIMVAPLDQGRTILDSLQPAHTDSPLEPGARPLRAAASEKTSDDLTGLGNRAMLMDRLGSMMTGGAILLIDLDGFKVVNDSFGHCAGDEILREVGSRLQQVTEASGLVCSLARIGGDEFAIAIDYGSGGGAVARLAGAILEQIARPFRVHQREIAISGSLGIRMIDRAELTPQDLLRDADLAMYRAKDLGRNRWHMFEPELRERALTRMSLVQDLRHATERGELFAAYQTKVDLRTRAIIGFEALVRWRHPERGLLLPATFIPLAEESGLIVPIGEWMLKEACGQLRKWQRRFPAFPPLNMSVNLSVKQLADPHLVECVRANLIDSGVAPDSLRLELTETALMTDLDTSRSVLEKMRALGVGLKLDDFGTGYSSFSYLGSLHFNSLKIDRSFVSRISSDPESEAIVDSIIRLAHALDMTVVAEGIENPEQADVLAKLGCDAGQGYYFSRPVEAHHAEQQLCGTFGALADC